jgi:alpha-tubulin suppressor-like RCC1 family protein
MAVTGPNTGFKIVNADGGPNTQDLGQRYVSVDYFIDTYPNIVNTLGALNSPGLWASGFNSTGGLGLNDTVHRSSPAQVGSLTNWSQVSISDSSIFGLEYSGGIKTDGTLWTWGGNDSGQLGLGNLTHRSSPTQVGALTNWKKIFAGLSIFLAIKTDGTLWSWGTNNNAILGQNNLTNYSSPVQVGSLTNWKQACSNGSASAAIKTDGTLWVWGTGNSGQSGLNDAVWRSSPTQVGSLTNWKQVVMGNSMTAATKTDGTLWTWGLNNNGQLGLNDTVNRSSPTQVGTLTNWKQVSCGQFHTIAIKTDGTLWTWGKNDSSQLGLNDIMINRSSPTQVGTLTNWKFLAAGGYHGAVLKTDGTLWTWGANQIGQLGLNDNINGYYSSPVQVGSLTNWKQVACGKYTLLAISDGAY